MRTAALLSLLVVGALLALLAPQPCYAQNDGGPAPVASGPVDPVTADAGAVEAEPADLVAQLKELRAKLDAVKSAQPGEKLLALAGLVAGVVFLLIAVIKRVTGITSRGKKMIPWVLMSLAVVGAVAASYAGGVSAFDAIVIAGGGPGSILINELWKSLRS